MGGAYRRQYHVAGEPRNYTDRVLRMLGAVEPRALPYTVRELGTLLLREGESEAWSKHRHDLCSFLCSLTAEMLSAIDSGPPRLWWARKAMADQRATQTVQYLRQSFQVHMEEGPAPIIKASNKEIQARLHVLQRTPLLGPVGSLDPRQAIGKALEDCRHDRRWHYLGIPVLGKVQPDILAKVLTVKLTADEQKVLEVSRLLAHFRSLPDSAENDTGPTGTQILPLAYSQIRDKLVQLYRGVVFGSTLSPAAAGPSLDGDPRGYQKVHDNLTLAADWLLLHEQLERAQAARLVVQR